MSLPTPRYASNLPDDVYPPSEDTFVLLDALEKDVTHISKIRPALITEIGTGSGVVITFALQLCKSLGFTPAAWGIDLNPNSLATAADTLKLNDITGTNDLILGNLVNGLCLRSQVDILLYNPPYVPTEEKAADNLAHTYAGGSCGRDALDPLLPQVPQLLSYPNGTFYLVALPQNDFQHIYSVLEPYGIHGQIVFRRRCGIEDLHVLRFTWINKEQN